MISIEAWRGRIGCWAGRVRFSSSSRNTSFFTFCKIADSIWGISTSLSACVICMLLIVGGIEINPGPPRKDLNSTSEDDIEVPTSFDFGEPSEGICVFSAPSTPIIKIHKRRVLVGSKKRPHKFSGHKKHDKVALAPEYSAIPTTSSQTSVTESLDVLELSAKVPRFSAETQIQIVPFLDSQEQQETPLPENQPKLTTAQTKISKSSVEDLPLAEMEIFVLGKPRGEKKNLCRVEGNALLNVGILEGALAEVSVCKFCRKGRLTFYRTSYNHGLALHYFIVCDQCFMATPFYTLPQNNSPSDSDTKIKFGHNILQILGGRLVGIGKSGLDFINCFIGLPSTLSNRAFSMAQAYLSKVSTDIAQASCMRAAIELRKKHNTVESEFLEVTVSYDGAYQKRGGKSGGGFSRYCFACAISVETGKVLSYEIACNSCKFCIEKQQALRDNRIGLVEYKVLKEIHKPGCQAREYGNYSSVALESKLAPVIFRKAIEQKLIYSTVIADGDDKSINILAENDIYGEYNIKIRREECLSHVQKRIRIHLCEKQKEFIASQKTLLQHELSQCKTEAQKKSVRELYRPSTLRDLKKGRDSWGDNEDLSNISNEINLLPDNIIDKITSLYGFVVKSRIGGNLNELREALFGIVYHLAANDDNCHDMHKYCEKGADSFCNYQKALALRNTIPKHPRCITSACRDRVLDILAPYFTVSFLEKVQGGNTSNLNENLHGMIWNCISKTKPIELGLMQLGCSLAIIRFNEGVAGLQNIIESLGLNSLISIDKLVNEFDNERIADSVRCVKNTKRRWSLKQAKRSRKRGATYKSGAYSQATSVPLNKDLNCQICGGSEESGILNKAGSNIARDVIVCVDWLCCDVCDGWYHAQCLRNINVVTGSVGEDDLWICPSCNCS